MSLSELWSLYGQNYIDALLATWGMTLESFAIAMVLAVAVTVMRVSPLKPLRVLATCMSRSSVTSPASRCSLSSSMRCRRSRSFCPTAPALSSPRSFWARPLAPRTL